MGSGSAKNNKDDPKSMKSQLENQSKKQIRSSKYAPFTEIEVQSLIKKFKTLDENTRNSITLDEFKNLLEIRMHFFRERIYSIIESDMDRADIITINFDLFMKILTVFHPLTATEDKFKYMFRIYDLDDDGVINQEDLTGVFELIYMTSAQSLRPQVAKRPKVFQTNFMNADLLKKLGKDIMNIVDSDKSNSIDFREFVAIFTNTDVYFRMNIVF